MNARQDLALRNCLGSRTWPTCSSVTYIITNSGFLSSANPQKYPAGLARLGRVFSEYSNFVVLRGSVGSRRRDLRFPSRRSPVHKTSGITRSNFFDSNYFNPFLTSPAPPAGRSYSKHKSISHSPKGWRRLADVGDQWPTP